MNLQAQSFLTMAKPVLLRNYYHTTTISLSASHFLIDKYNSSISPSLIQKSDSLLSFLKKNGFSDTHLEKVVKYEPKFLASSLERNIKPKIKIFKEFGFSADEIAEVIANDPSILYRSAVRRIIPALSVLKNLLGSSERVAKLLMKPGWILFADLEKTLLPNVDILKECGVRMEQINTVLFTQFKFFLVKPVNMRRFIDKVDAMGVERSSNMFIYAVRAVSSMGEEAWKLKLKTFKDMGFSENDILRTFRSTPVLFTVSGPKMMKIIEVLLETGKYDMSCIVENHKALMYSVEKRYKPRLRVLKILEEKSLVDKWPSLLTLTSMTDKKFFDKYVAPHVNEVGEAFVVKN